MFSIIFRDVESASYSCRWKDVEFKMDTDVQNAKSHVCIIRESLNPGSDDTCGNPGKHLPTLFLLFVFFVKKIPSPPVFFSFF